MIVFSHLTKYFGTYKCRQGTYCKFRMTKDRCPSSLRFSDSLEILVLEYTYFLRGGREKHLRRYDQSAVSSSQVVNTKVIGELLHISPLICRIPQNIEQITKKYKAKEDCLLTLLPVLVIYRPVLQSMLPQSCVQN